MTEIEKLVKDYLEYLEIQKQRSPKTIENYGRYLARFLDWAKIESPAEINLDLVGRFQEYLANLEVGLNRRLPRRPSPSANSGSGLLAMTDNSQPTGLHQATRYYHLIALRGFLKYLAKNNIGSLKAQQVSLGQPPSRQVAVLGDQEVEQLLNAAGGKDLAQVRDQAILEVLFSTGLRVAQLCVLNREDFDQGQLAVHRLKPAIPTATEPRVSTGLAGLSLRSVYLSEPAQKALNKYLKQRQDKSHALFVNLGRGQSQGQISRLTARSIQRIVKKYALQAGINPVKVTPSALRHAFAYGLLRAGAEIESIQRLLGHAHLSTTQVYTRLTKQE